MLPLDKYKMFPELGTQGAPGDKEIRQQYGSKIKDYIYCRIGECTIWAQDQRLHILQDRRMYNMGARSKITYIAG